RYCNQVLDKDIDDRCQQLLQDLVRYQEDLYLVDPGKAKRRKRFVLGLREVAKHLKMNHLVGVIISPNLEQNNSKGQLIIEMCQKQDVVFIFALGRRALGKACAKLVPVSVVGIFSTEGVEVR
ncbi:hypothetical protein HELRODRAFT_89822, partial [Helobdella robusta]|uniref:Ribosomal protein eL8/eL30/eS12/Gadd45 domain-containing protein n=1 Tax=Helobdella robusta TaxID=6412 RepID=T1G7I1_HELRO